MTTTVVQVLWGVSLAVAALVVGLGIELHLDGAGALVSHPLVVGGILLLPAASAALERLGGLTSPPTQG
ncbi:hypothetical protein [Nocardioides deserti]|uniref:Uncharacterized protein n=1 Tax=Nocardioides deserti TaxID=1588644 RepID=A0ABR6U8Y2_9ACTN|nr:hypothetical protein [Nocardioides deserti]MBC2960907.1 hypothetical protein [Nocardioides deserti]GGO77740.1 hypothetical protein GCM10012276_33550 [Nocardioides deserti]